MRTWSITLAALAVSAMPLQAQNTGTLIVTVHSKNGPVAQAQVTAGGMKQTTDADGVVTLALPPGRVDVVVTKADFDPGAAQIDVRAGTESRIDVDLEPESELEENVVVSATRTEQRIGDIPLRVEVVPAEEVGEKIAMSPGNVSMLLGETNGLRMQTTSPALGGASLRIQGLSGRYSQILSDGLPLYGAQSGSVGILQIPPMDLAQVEVIKGVASALYGMSAIGGVVNLVSRRPKATEHEVLVNRTNHRGTDGALWLAQPLNTRWNYSILGGVHWEDRSDFDHDGWSDLPMFRRVAGHKESERMRVVRDKATELYAAVRKWTEHIPQNLPYVDLYFAFALAKLQESTQAKKLIEDARATMELPIPASKNPQEDSKVVAAVVSNFLFHAFKFRIDQVLASRPHTGQLSPELMAELDAIHKQSGGGPANNPYKLAHYVISRMRDQSYILEPHEKLDPYSEWTKSTDPLKKELSELHDIREPGKLADRIRKLHRDGPQGRTTKGVQFLVLHESLSLAPRVGEAFTVELLQLVPAAMAGTATPAGQETADWPKKQGELLSRALYFAGHFDRSDLVKRLVDEFSDLIHNKPEDSRFKLINYVAGQCLRSLKKFGLRDEIDRFLTKLHSGGARGQTTEQLKKKHASKPDMWAQSSRLCSTSRAGGSTTSSTSARNPSRTRHARNFSPTRPSSRRRSTLKSGLCHRRRTRPRGYGPGVHQELFRQKDAKRITNTWTTAQYYSRFHLNLVEDTIRAIISDDFALGPSGRKWLDDDEYLVRRRVHADMRRHLDKSGL